MLASHNSKAFVRTYRNDAAANQLLFSIGIALIEASAHLRAAASHLLRSMPEADSQIGPLARRTESAAAGDPERPGADSRDLGGSCEAIVENEW
jgi:hypothetical protein